MAKELFKVAVATSDGINVDSHFGHVAEFVIYEVDSKTGEGEPIEERGIDKYGCQDGTCGGEVFDEIAESLAEAGIEFVLAAKIGPRALQALTRQTSYLLHSKYGSKKSEEAGRQPGQKQSLRSRLKSLIHLKQKFSHSKQQLKKKALQKSLKINSRKKRKKRQNLTGLS